MGFAESEGACLFKCFAAMSVWRMLGIVTHTERTESLNNEAKT